MTVDISYQAFSFLLAVLLGAALGVVYDVFKVLRLVGLKGKVIVFFEDILFFLISTIAIYSYYMEITDGKARIYPVIAAVIGFWLYFKTVEKPVFWIVKTIYKGITISAEFLFKYMVKKPVKLALKFLKKAFAPIYEFVYKKIIRNIIIFFKNLLPKKDKMLYNVRRISKKGKEKRRHAQKSGEKAEDRKKVFVF